VLSFMHPSVLRATDQVVRAALSRGWPNRVRRSGGKSAGVCLLGGMGVRNLSMNPFSPRVYVTFYSSDFEQTEAAARDALASRRRTSRQIVASNFAEQKCKLE